MGEMQIKVASRFTSVKKRSGKQMTRNAGEDVGKGNLYSVWVEM